MNEIELDRFKRCFGDIDGEVFFQIVSGIINRTQIEKILDNGSIFTTLLRLCNLGILEKISDNEFVLNDNISDLQTFLDIIPFIPRSKKEIYDLYRGKERRFMSMW